MCEREGVSGGASQEKEGPTVGSEKVIMWKLRIHRDENIVPNIYLFLIPRLQGLEFFSCTGGIVLKCG